MVFCTAWEQEQDKTSFTVHCFTLANERGGEESKVASLWLGMGHKWLVIKDTLPGVGREKGGREEVKIQGQFEH